MTTARALASVETTDTPTVYQALIGVMRDMKAVGKDSTNEQQRFKYRGIDAVMNAAHPLFAEHGVLMIPTVLERISETRETKSGGSMNVVHLRIKYTFYGPAGDSVAAEVWGEAQDSADKASNKALAVGMKYALFQTLCIPTEDQALDDPDRTTVEAAPASDEAVIAQFELDLEAATTILALRAVYAQVTIAKKARKLTAKDAEDMHTLILGRVRILEAEKAEPVAEPML
jgi:hypothetical protein